MMTLLYNNETIGISAEIAIADTFEIPLAQSYRERGVQSIVDQIKLVVEDVFKEYNIPRPVGHIAEGQNPIDFVLEDNLTLSVKTNQSLLGKAAPQNIGQPTSNTYFKHFSKYITELPDDYKERSKLFKEISINNIDEVITEYWNNMFDCDYLIHFYNIINKTGSLTLRPSYVVFKKFQSPIWKKDNFTFTQSLSTWNESCTVKYCNTTIGEFQVHSNRDCFKFRFNMNGIINLIDSKII